VRKGINLTQRVLGLSLVLLFSTANLAQSGRSRQERPAENNSEDTIKIESTLINLSIVASDGEGKYVPGLKKEDFVILEDGIRQEIEFFSSETIPFHVVLLLDSSSSTKNTLPLIKEAARAFITNLRTNDKVMVISFASEITVENEFTSNRSILTQAIRTIKTEGGTRLYDAVLLAARDELKGINGRKALILLSDGDDTSSYMHAKYAISESVESGALVYVVKYPKPYSPFQNQYSNRTATRTKFTAQYPYPYNYNFIGELIDKTGGKLFESGSFNNLTNIMKSVAEELRHVYSIAYYPLNPIQNGGYRKIELRLRDKPDVLLRYKRGYDASGLDKGYSHKKASRE
jgi:Ca-activated chloride channel homolog